MDESEKESENKQHLRWDLGGSEEDNSLLGAASAGARWSAMSEKWGGARSQVHPPLCRRTTTFQCAVHFLQGDSIQVPRAEALS